jgi:hypothetical protein
MILPSAGVLTTAITAITEIEIARLTCTLSYWDGNRGGCLVISHTSVCMF